MKCCECGSVEDLKEHGPCNIVMCGACRRRFPQEPCEKCRSDAPVTRHSTGIVLCDLCRMDLNFMILHWKNRQTRNICVSCRNDLPLAHTLKRYRDGYLCEECEVKINPTRISLFRWG